jgi:acyl-CoA reductase-like NAD-dependent aldehyde dehydrogenase
MDQAIENLVDISASPAAMHAAADMVLERARWASQIFQRYDRETTLNIADAVAQAAHDSAGKYGDWAVRETGFGVADHKRLKNELTAKPLVDHYRDQDFVNPRFDGERNIIEVPKPAGVVFALAPSTNPISTIYFKVLCALMTRNAIVISPHPAARECSIDAVNTLIKAAETAGAPEAVIQVIECPTLALIDEFMKSDKTNVILATGGSAMVRAAYSSSNPAIGVGPGNAPVFVDASADLKQAASFIAESKSFDNSVLCTNESVLITLVEISQKLMRELSRNKCHICKLEEVELLRRYLFHDRGFNVEALGRDASWIAEQAGFKVGRNTKILVTPIDKIGVGEVLSREKLCPVLGYYVATSIAQAITQARALLRYTGAGHSAAIHSNDNQTIMDYAASVEVYWVIVNAPCSQGAAGFATNLAPTFTIGTGYFGRSSVGENVGPQHLVNWTRIAWHKESLGPLNVDQTAELKHRGKLPKAPADGVPGQIRVRREVSDISPQAHSRTDHSLREEIRRIISEELRLALKD